MTNQARTDSQSIAVPSIPSIFTLELTTLCNNRCSGCANIEVPEQRQLRQESHKIFMVNWREIIRQIIDQTKGQAVIRLSGGEPTLHPEFSEIVSYLDSFGVAHALLTTGRWQKINPQHLINIYQKTKNLAGFLVSLHGSESDIHNSFVESTDKAFAETIHNIQEATQQGITVFTNTVITSRNFHEVESVVHLSQELGAKYAIFNRFLALEHSLLPTEAQLYEALDTVQKLKRQGFSCRVGNKIPPCFFPLTNYPSVAGFELCHISPQGFVRPDNLTALQIGNILHDPLSKIWQSRILTNYRNCVPSSCTDCAAFNSCRGGAKSLYMSTSNQVDPLMRTPLSIEQTQVIGDDKEKKMIPLLALTSD